MSFRHNKNNSPTSGRRSKEDLGCGDDTEVLHCIEIVRLAECHIPCATGDRGFLVAENQVIVKHVIIALSRQHVLTKLNTL